MLLSLSPLRLLILVLWPAVNVGSCILAEAIPAFSATPCTLRIPHSQKSATVGNGRRMFVARRASNKELCMSGRKDLDSGMIGKAAWVAAEALGNAARITVAGGGVLDSGGDGEEERVITKEEAVMRLRADYERDYFISGKVDADLYEEDCLFADPFASFRGRDRFVNNLCLATSDAKPNAVPDTKPNAVSDKPLNQQNLGMFVSKSDCRLLSFETTAEEPLTVKTRVLVKLQLKLPWEPVLAWPWGVEHVYSPSGRIAEHIESWEIAAMEGIMQVFRKAPPGGLKPSSKTAK